MQSIYTLQYCLLFESIRTQFDKSNKSFVDLPHLDLDLCYCFFKCLHIFYIQVYGLSSSQFLKRWAVQIDGWTAFKQSDYSQVDYTKVKKQLILVNKLIRKQQMFVEQNISQLSIDIEISLDAQNSADQYIPHPLHNSNKQKQSTNTSVGIFLNQSCDDGMLLPQKEGLKKIAENKAKYKKLKQKINGICEQIQGQGFLKDQKDLVSPNKSRLVKLALELQKSLKTQAIDYQLVESFLKQIQKILEYKRQHDILILRGVRMMNTIFTIIKRFPSLHRNQALQSMPALEMSLKILRIMMTLSCNREYIFISNQMTALGSLLSCALMRQQKKLITNTLYLLNLLVAGPNLELHPLLNANIQYILCSCLLKRLKLFIENCISEDDPSNSQFLLLAFRFYYLIMCISCSKELERPVYSSKMVGDSLFKAINAYFESGIQLLSQSIIDLIYQKQSEGQQKYLYKQSQISNFKINILLYILKTLNLIFHVDIFYSQKVIDCNYHFMDALLYIFQEVKSNFQQNLQTKRLCSEIIIFIGNIAFQNFQIQQIIRTSGILQSLCNHPIQYLMDPSLRNILIPTYCCVIFENNQNFIKTFEENSAQPIIQYIEKQMNYRNERKNEQDQINEGGFSSCKNINSSTLSRKTSVSSITSTYSKASMAQSFSTQTSNTFGLIERQMRLEQKFRPQFWQKLIAELKAVQGY